MRKLAYFALLATALGILLVGCEGLMNPTESPLSDQVGTSLMKAGGSIIAFQKGPQGETEVYVMNSDGSGQFRLTYQAGHDGYPDLSPNGKKIAFESTRDGNLEIYVMNSDGTGQTNLTNSPALDGDPDWSPDGKKILWGRMRDGISEICVMNADGSDQTVVHVAEGTYYSSPVWSPNGKKIAFQSNVDGNQEIYVINADGTGRTRLTYQDRRDWFPSWSPNGKKIAFVSARDQNYEIYVMNADGSDQTRLTNTPQREYNNPSWSSDGKQIAFDSYRDGNYEIYVMNADGSAQMNVSNSPASDDAAPNWGQGSLPDPNLILDINFAYPGFTASIFSNHFAAADGIVPPADKKLLVVKESPAANAGVFYAREGDEFSLDDAFSTLGPPFVSPDDMTMGQGKEIYVADGQAQTVFKLSHQGGTPVPFVTISTTGSASFNPFGVTIAPANFDGPNVDPGDLIVADNAYGNIDRAVWAVNPNTGVAKIIAQGTAFDDGPISVAFSSDGTLYVFENNGIHGSSRILILSADGTVTPFLTGLGAFFGGSIAIHPITDEIFYKQEEGEIWRIPKTGGTPQLFASNIGTYQDMEFDKKGTSLYVSVRGPRSQVIQISADKKTW